MAKTGQPSDSSRARVDAKGKFLATLAETGIVSAAVKAAGVARSTAYEWRENDPAFAAAWASAEETATDALEAEARRRAIDGWDEPVFQGGKDVGTIRRYSDRMLEILLKGHRHRFRENSKVEVSGPNGGPVQFQTVADLARAMAAAPPSKPSDPPAAAEGAS